MKCQICGKKTDVIHAVKEWISLDMDDGNLYTHEYMNLDDYSNICPDDLYCKDCYEDLKRRLS
jgi:hypothetical protein